MPIGAPLCFRLLDVQLHSGTATAAFPAAVLWLVPKPDAVLAAVLGIPVAERTATMRV